MGIFRGVKTLIYMLNGSWIIVVALASASVITAAESFSSGPAHVALIELYTSEGCSSCPPAEEWLGQRKEDPGLWSTFVPISFHITYWDNLGWKDELARPAFTARQRHYASEWGRGSVYTPCFVRDGVEWQISEIKQQKSRAPGILTLHSRTTGEWELSFVPEKGSTGDFEGHVALLGRGITSKVRAGENKGRTLAHDFVALALQRARLKTTSEANEQVAVFRLEAAGSPLESRAIAAWVTRVGDIQPLQATGGDLK